MQMLNLPFALCLTDSNLAELLDLETIKNYLKLEYDEDDNLLNDLRQAATAACEKYLGKSITAKTYMAQYYCQHPYCKLLYGPVTGVKAVYQHQQLQKTLLPPQAYYLYDDNSLLRLDEPLAPTTVLSVEYCTASSLCAEMEVPVMAEPEPAMQASADSAMTVKTVLAADICQGLLMHIASMYEQRDGSVLIPNASVALYYPYRKIRL